MFILIKDSDQLEVLVDHTDLVQRCLKRERIAQYELYQRYARAMFNVALRLMGNREEAEDMLQVSFVKIFHCLENYRGESTLGSWMKRIVVNQCLSELRKKRLSFDAVDEKMVFIDEDEDHEEVQYRTTLIKKAMEDLPDGYRTIFSLYMMEGYDHAEIGQLLNISESTSKSQLSRAKKKVQEIVRALS